MTTRPTHLLARAFVAPFRLFGMTAKDGWPSFTKCIVVAIVVSYFVHSPIPEMVAIVVILASQSGKSLTEYLSLRPGSTTKEVTTSTKITAPTPIPPAGDSHDVG